MWIHKYFFDLGCDTMKKKNIFHFFQNLKPFYETGSQLEHVGGHFKHVQKP